MQLKLDPCDEMKTIAQTIATTWGGVSMSFFVPFSCVCFSVQQSMAHEQTDEEEHASVGELWAHGSAESVDPAGSG